MLLYPLLAGLLLLPSFALAALPDFEPEPGLRVQVEKQGEHYFLQQPDGSRLALSIPEGNDSEAPSFEIGDYNFDDHHDLAIRVSVGMVNSAYHLYLYQPTLRRFEILYMPSELMERVNCSWLSELHPNKEQRALYSHCRSGPGWYYDAYRFDAAGTPWLYKTLYLSHDYHPDYPYVFFPVFERTLDRQGKVVASRTLDENDQQQTWIVPSPRLYLHGRPDVASRSKAYLIKGDVCEVLDQQGNWLHISYHSRKGPLERWISLNEAYDLHQFLSSAPHPDGLSLSMADFSQADYPNFSLGLAGMPVALRHAEVHLLLNKDDGTRYSHRLYAFHHNIEPNERGGALLDDNFIENHDGRFVIYHPNEQGEDAFVPFFPQLPPGQYRVRAALTAPALTAPVFSDEEVLIDYPPQIAEKHRTP